MPVAMLASPNVMRTGTTGEACELAAIRSSSDEANMAVIAEVELSGPPTAKGIELPNASTAAMTADEMKVTATP